jgi:nucleobase:cation symporter-1, NCS1 family
MASFLIFWLIQLPFLCIHPNKLRWLFIAKSVIVPATWIAMLIWAFVSTGGGDLFEQKRTVSGSQFAWLWLANLNSVLGNFATLSVNQVSETSSDEQRDFFLIRCFHCVEN